MKNFKLIFFIIFSSLVVHSCQEEDLDILPDDLDPLETAINSEDKLQSFFTGAYISISDASAFGSEAIMFGDLLSDNVFVSNIGSTYMLSYNMNYTAVDNDFKFYGTLYNVINICNTVINNTIVAENENVLRIKAEAKILRAFAYFHLVSSYSPSPTSGENQEYGVPLVLGDYDPTIQPPRATVAEVYQQIINDLQEGLVNAKESPSSKVFLSKNAARLILSRVYLTRRAPGDAELALQYSTEIVNNANGNFAPISTADNPVDQSVYVNYFSASDDLLSEDQHETIWELDFNINNNAGVNNSLAVYYHRTGMRKSFMLRRSFYDSFPESDMRRGLLDITNVPSVDNPSGVWTKKWVRISSGGNFTRNNKILRFSEAQLNRIEALYLTGQTTEALNKLNEFALSRGGNTYTGTNLLNDILTERQKEFYAEGYRFYDLKRYNLPIVKETNCYMNCNIPANDKLFVFPMSENTINQNANLTQYPGY